MNQMLVLDWWHENNLLKKIEKAFRGSTLNLQNHNFQGWSLWIWIFFFKFLCGSSANPGLKTPSTDYIPYYLFKEKLASFPQPFKFQSLAASLTPPFIPHIQSGNALGSAFKLYLESFHSLPLPLLVPRTNHLSVGLFQQTPCFSPSLLSLILNIAAKVILLKPKLHLVIALLKSSMASHFTVINLYLLYQAQHVNKALSSLISSVLRPALLASLATPGTHQSRYCLRACAQSVPSAKKTLPPDISMANSHLLTSLYQMSFSTLGLAQPFYFKL